MVIPKKEVVGTQLSLFGDTKEVIQIVPGFVNTVNRLKRLKGEPTGRYTQRLLPEGINLDLFIARPDNWGNTYAVRTGSGEFSHRVLATTWNKKGYISQDGMLHKAGKAIQLYEEEELFNLLGLKWIHPADREVGDDY